MHSFMFDSSIEVQDVLGSPEGVVMLSPKLCNCLVNQTSVSIAEAFGSTVQTSLYCLLSDDLALHHGNPTLLPVTPNQT